MASVIRVSVLGDESSLRRAFANATRDARKFASTTDSTFARSANQSAAAYRTAFSKIGRRDFIAGAAGGATALAAQQAFAFLKSSFDAAAKSQQVLGQTKVALEATGKSWDQYGRQIEAATKKLARLGFDDEELLQTFSLLQRRTGDVTKALRLNALAADVARGRYISVSQAALLVLKASLGQAGALRRVGIDAKKGSSGIELLTLLTQKYGGAAAAAQGEATASSERLRNSLQNVQETIGSGMLPVVAQLASVLSDAADGANALSSSLGRLGGVKLPGFGRVGDALRRGARQAIEQSPTALGPFAQALRLFRRGGEPGSPDVAGQAAAFNSAFGLGSIAGFKTPASAGTNNPFRVGRASPVVTTLSTRLRGSLLDAQRTAGTGDDLRVLARQKTFLENALRDVRLKPGQTLGLKQELAGVLGDIQAIQDAASAKLKEAADKQKSAAEEARRKAADKLKQGAIDKLDLFKSARDNQRALADARDQLKIANMIGTPEGIKLAKRDLEDARLERQRLALQGVSFTTSRGPQQITGVPGGSVVININGTPLNEQQLTRAVLTALRKTGKRNAAQTRGRTPGHNVVGTT